MMNSKGNNRGMSPNSRKKWESLDMVLRYIRSVNFEDSLRLYRRIEGVSRTQ